jgi:hypothetical protein
MPISSNRRQRVIEFATPKVADLVIVERVDCSKNVNAAATAYDSTYGTAHPDATRFPDFKLAVIKNSDDDQGQFQDWYYVKDRANQDDYNWEFQAAGAESPRYDTVVRTYVIPRASPASAGSNVAGIDYFDTNSPKIGFNVATNTAALLKLGQRKDENTYMPSGDTEITPFNGAFLTTDTPSSLTSDPIKFDTDYIFFERKQVRSGDDFLDTLYVVEQRVYVKRVAHRRVDVDDAFPYNDPADGSSVKDFGALVSKETIIHKNETVKATISFIDSSSANEGVQEGGTPGLMEVTGSGTYGKSASYVFTNPDTIYRVGTEAYTHNNSGSNQDYNFWGVDAYGIMREGKQLSDNWYALVERQVIKTSNYTNKVSKYTTYQNYSWPAVLTPEYDQQGNMDENASPNGGIYGYTWTRRAGGGDTVIYPVYSRYAYNGPTKTEVTIFWRKEKFALTGNTAGTDGGDNALTKVVPMLPLPISFISPLSSVNVPPTLHDKIDLTITTGTEHPTWELAGATFSYAATNYTDWPTSMIVSDTQKPYRGGWLRERIKIYAPTEHTTDMTGSQNTDVATS